MSGCVVGRPAPSSTVSSLTSAVLTSSSIGSGSTPTTRTTPLPLALDHEMRERFEARLVAKEPARLARIRERDLAEVPEPLVARAEQARGLEQRAGLERDALEVRGLRGVRVVTLHPLQRLAAHERETRAREDLRALEVSHLRELAEGAREEIVARRDRSVRPVRAPDGLVPAPQLGAVDQVVVHERRRVDELDRDAASQRALAVVGRQVDEQRPQAFSPGVERVVADTLDDAGMAHRCGAQARLELVQERRRLVEDGLIVHRCATWSETMPPPSSR